MVIIYYIARTVCSYLSEKSFYFILLLIFTSWTLLIYSFVMIPDDILLSSIDYVSGSQNKQRPH